MTESLQQPTIVVPVHPRQCGQLHFLPVFPALSVYHLRFVQTVDTFGHGLIIFVCSLLLEGGWQQTLINITTLPPITGWPMASLYITSVIASIGIALYALRNILHLLCQWQGERR